VTRFGWSGRWLHELRARSGPTRLVGAPGEPVTSAASGLGDYAPEARARSNHEQEEEAMTESSSVVPFRRDEPADPAPTVVMLPPPTGEAFDIELAEDAARGLDAIAYLRSQLDELAGLFKDRLREESERLGTKTLHYDDLTVELRGGGEEAHYDPELTRECMEQVDLPEERMNKLVKAQVTYTVDRNVVRQLVGANPVYADALERARTWKPQPLYVSVRRKRR
jgi:hypothetical protein